MTKRVSPQIDAAKKSRSYRGLRPAARMLGVSQTHLSEVLSGRRKPSEKLREAILLLLGIRL